jgi:LPXTG-motif cell wall-anchored protein
VCQADIPYIQYAIEVSGTPNTTATITFIDNKGVEVARHENQPFTGKLIYPGASVNPADWPGWKLENGKWVIDPTDANFRDGLTVRVEVNPTATASVTYPPATELCNGPTFTDSQAPTTTTPAQQTPTTTAPPAQQAPVTQLPSTGSNSTGLIAGLGLLLLLAGGVLAGVVRRPRHA